MNVHKNARLTPQGRALMVKRILSERWKVSQAAEAAGISPRRAYHWLARFRAGAEPALSDRSPAPARCPRRRTAHEIAAIERLRRQRMTGPEIARMLAIPRSTVGAILRRLGLGRLSVLDKPPPAIRYERERPGELIHIDIKKLGRIDGIGHRITGDRTGQSHRRGKGQGIGWEYLHVAIDDACRLAYTELLPNERKESAIAFLGRALHWFARHGITVERVMTDNGSAYRSKDFRAVIAAAALKHKRTRPYTPRTNGKAERFIQTSLREWAYAKAYRSSDERTAALQPWLADYNNSRPHSALGGRPPMAKLNNVLGFDT
jgi:transposase InsO family protein